MASSATVAANTTSIEGGQPGASIASGARPTSGSNGQAAGD